MQIYEASLGQDQRPGTGEGCPRCGGFRRLHKHGRFPRFRGMHNGQQVQVQRFICPLCRQTCSVIPAGMMPYRSMEVERFENLADASLARDTLADGGARPPPATEKEESCIQRAFKKLSERIPLFSGLFGQQLPLPASKDLCCFWQALRALGSTADTLLRLARDFNTSLLGCYRSLLPH